MAGALSKASISYNLLEYFRKEKRRSEEYQGQSVNTGYHDTAYCKSPRRGSNTSKCESLGILTDRPQYFQYGTLESRIASFEHWPDDKTQNKTDLAEAGFAYTGVDDCVRCFHCSIGLRDWPYGASPWEQHVLASPKCGHVIQCKGRSFVKKLLGEDLSDSDVEDDADFVDTVQLAMKRNKEAVTAAREYCDDEELVKEAVKAVIKFDLQKKFSAVELVEVIDTLQEKAEKEGYYDASSDTEDDISESEDVIEEKNRELKANVTCKICFEAMACIITLPCGHMVSCPQCISALTKCAVCRSRIMGTIRSLMAV